jgi:hypothetical protein
VDARPLQGRTGASIPLAAANAAAKASIASSTPSIAWRAASRPASSPRRSATRAMPSKRCRSRLASAVAAAAWNAWAAASSASSASIVLGTMTDLSFFLRTWIERTAIRARRRIRRARAVSGVVGGGISG